jgi:hypothetical protein
MLDRDALDERMSEHESKVGAAEGVAEAVLLICECLIDLAEAVEASGVELPDDFDDRVRRISDLGGDLSR